MFRRAARTSMLAMLALAVATGPNVASATLHRASKAAGGPVWKPIAPAPIAGRISAGVVWTGQEMIVWGGVARGTTIEAASDGAAYDAAAGTWRPIASSPHGVLGGGGRASAWTGKRAVFWAGNSPDGPAKGALYNPATDTWVKLPTGPLGTREGYVSVWTGTELIIIGGTSGDAVASPVAAALKPSTRTWRRLPGLNGLHALVPSGAVWSGSRVFLAGTQYLCADPSSSCTDTRPIFVSYDPATDQVEEIDLSLAPVTSVTPIGWTGSAVLAAGASSADLVLYDPTDGTWASASAAPCAPETSLYRQTAWLGNRYVATCGREALQIYDVASDSWQVVDAGPSPLNTRLDSAIAWTGKKLIAWSGTVRRTGNPTPNSGMAIRLGP
jgi:hypothetical protein